MLNDKVCLVTGSAGGIGRATAIEMARQKAAAVMICAVLILKLAMGSRA